MSNAVFLASLSCLLLACGDDSSSSPDAPLPTEVRFGDTALVVVLNPFVNDANADASVPAPGQTLAGVTATSDDGKSATTDASGIAVLAPLTAGARTVTLSGGGIDASFTVTLTAGALREVAVAANGATAQTMVELDYKSDRVVEIAPTMPIAEVNAALDTSDTVVFFAGGVYVGDLDFAGSRVTLFGEGALGGTVTIQGNVTMSGSDSRIRGTHITGNLTVPASGTGLSFSRVDGRAESIGSDTTFLANALCGEDMIGGSGTIALGNVGAVPSTSCP